jgi:hypothetical protein
MKRYKMLKLAAKNPFPLQGLLEYITRTGPDSTVIDFHRVVITGIEQFSSMRGFRS